MEGFCRACPIFQMREKFAAGNWGQLGELYPITLILTLCERTEDPKLCLSFQHDEILRHIYSETLMYTHRHNDTSSGEIAASKPFHF